MPVILIKRALATLAAMAVLSGCASFSGAPAPPLATDLAVSDPLYGKAVTAFYQTNANRKDVRNQFIEMRSALIDQDYSRFKQRLHSERVSSSVGVDWATLALGSISAGASAASVKTAAGALTALVAGGKASIDKNVYFDRALPAMLSQMEAQRAEMRNHILNGMQLDPARYSLLQARSDLLAYADAGTIPGAIVQLTKAAAVRQEAAEDKLRERTEDELTRELMAKNFEVRRAAKDDLAALMQKCFDPVSKQLSPEVMPTVRAMFSQEGIAAPTRTDIALLAVAADKEPLRKKLFASDIIVAQFKACKF